MLRRQHGLRPEDSHPRRQLPEPGVLRTEPPWCSGKATYVVPWRMLVRVARSVVFSSGAFRGACGLGVMDVVCMPCLWP